MTSLLLLAVQMLLTVPAPVGRLAPAGVSTTRWLLLAGAATGTVLFLLSGHLSAVVAVLLVGATATWTVRDMQATRGRLRRQATVAAFLGHLAGELRAGHPVGRAVEHATGQLPADTPADLARTLRQVSAHTQRGGSGARLLLASSTTAPELEGLGAYWMLAERHGLPLAPLMEQAQQRIDVRLRHRAATAATLQGPQATAVILTLLPLAGVAMGTAMGADPLGLLFGGGPGGVLLIVGTALLSAGFLWSRRIIGRAAT